MLSILLCLVCIYAGVLLNRRLCSDSRKQAKLFQIQKSAIEDLLRGGGVSQVLKFASTSPKAGLVGEVMADLDQPEFDAALLPALLDKTNHKLLKQTLVPERLPLHSRYLL
jgi:hypothetical protein